MRKDERGDSSDLRRNDRRDDRRDYYRRDDRYDDRRESYGRDEPRRDYRRDDRRDDRRYPPREDFRGSDRESSGYDRPRGKPESRPEYLPRSPANDRRRSASPVKRNPPTVFVAPQQVAYFSEFAFKDGLVRIRDLNGLKLHLKKYLRPESEFGKCYWNLTPTPFLDREGLYDDLLNTFINRLKKRVWDPNVLYDENLDQSEDLKYCMKTEAKLVDLFNLICGAPGSGKTRAIMGLKRGLLEAFERRTDKHLLVVKHMQTILMNTVYLCVTLNAGSPNDIHDDPSSMLYLRMLYEFFISKDVTFNDFRAIMAPFKVDYVTQMILEASGKQNLILAVDEIGNMNGEALQYCLSSVSYLLSTVRNTQNLNHVILTSSTTLNLDDIFSKSRRGYHKSKLLPLNNKKVLQSWFENSEDKMLYCLVEHCGGHARSLYFLSELLGRDFNVDNQPWTMPSISFYDVLNGIISRLNLTKHVYKILAPIILRHKLPATYEILDGVTFDTLCSTGVYLNSFNDSECEVPEMSLIQFYAMCRKGVAFGINSPKSMELKKCSELLLGMEMSPEVEGAQFRGELYEQFHSIWEVIYRLFVEKDYIQFEDIYAGAIVNPESDVLKLTLKVPECMRYVRYHLQFENMTDRDFKVLLKGDAVYHFGDQNPGFDSAYFTLTDDGAPLFVLIENRFSTEDASTVDSNNVWTFKYVTSRESLSLKVKQFTAKSSDIQLNNFQFVFVYAGFRNITLQPKKLKFPIPEQNIPNNMIILDINSLRKTYGPGLRLGFLR